MGDEGYQDRKGYGEDAQTFRAEKARDAKATVGYIQEAQKTGAIGDKQAVDMSIKTLANVLRTKK